MNTQEIRVGNFVNNGYKIEAIHRNAKLGSSKEADYFHSAYIKKKDNFNHVKISALKPEILTKDWLLDFDFKCVNQISHLYLMKLKSVSIYVNLLNVGPQWKIEIRHKNNPYRIIEFVHQLQNYISDEMDFYL